MIVTLTPPKILQALFWLRSFAILGQVCVLALSTWFLGLDLPLGPMGLTICCLALWNVGVWWRMKNDWVATQEEILLNLIIDATALTFLLYWAGGATNPFVSLYLIPIAITAAALPAGYIWGMTLICISFYSYLMLFYTPLPPAHEHFGSDFNLHVFGMWVNFILSAALMALVVAAIAGMVRRREQSLAKAREEALNNEKIVAMGTLAAGAAHEISTPLSTMTLLIDELKAQAEPNGTMEQDLELLKQQVGLCKQRIKELLDHSGHGRSEGGQAEPLSSFLNRLLDQWQLMRPEIRLNIRYQAPFIDPTILGEQTIAQAITNLLNNAADASVANGKDEIDIDISCSNRELIIDIDDSGSGITPEQASQAGRAFFSSKESGHGVGLVLSNASLGRFGGEIRLNNRSEGGTRTEIRLPLEQLIIPDEG